MELLIKNVEDKENPKLDNSDKKQLFEKDHRPRTASEHREEWGFIEDTAIRENISYQMQYLEFQVYLYNDYQLYLTIESLTCKNIMTRIGGVIESALFGLVSQSMDKAGQPFDDRTSFLDLIDKAFDMGIIDRNLRSSFHNLRKVRNLLHLSSLDYQEYKAYEFTEVNEYIETLNRFIGMQNASDI